MFWPRRNRGFGTLALSFVWLLVLWPSIGFSSSSTPYDKPFAVPITAREITAFNPVEPKQTVFGKLEYLSGIELFSSNEHFGGYSGFRFLDDDGRFVAISDIGFWLTGTVERRDGKLAGITNATAAPIRNIGGQLLPGKWSADAEGLEIVGNTALMTFERNHRVEFHDLDLVNFSGNSRSIGIRFSKLGLRGNKGLEAVAWVPPELQLNFEYLFFAERSLNSSGHNRAFYYSNGRLEEFSVRRDKDFDVTAAAFLPDGGLVLLERRYNIANGVALRFRKTDATKIKKSAILDGEVLMEADMSYQIDNFEGLAVSKNSDGETILTIISDDNHFILQRTLLLEFKLLN